ncbi:MAG: GNAT family N-acetyltransferase [Kineosporiaceae bacterium]
MGGRGRGGRDLSPGGHGTGGAGPAVRRAGPGDEPAYRRLFEAVAAEGTGIGAEAPVDWDTSRLDGLRRRLSGDDDTEAVLVAEVDGEVAGAVSLGRQPRTGNVDFSMVVAGARRGRGVGGALMDAALAWSRRVGAPRLTCQVWPHNTAALGLYLSRGMRVEGRLRRHWPRRNGERWDGVLMGLVLDESAPGSPHPDSPLLERVERGGAGGPTGPAAP